MARSDNLESERVERSYPNQMKSIAEGRQTFSRWSMEALADQGAPLSTGILPYESDSEQCTSGSFGIAKLYFARFSYCIHK